MAGRFSRKKSSTIWLPGAMSRHLGLLGDDLPVEFQRVFEV